LQYKFNIERIIVNDREMDIQISGEFIDPSINSDSLSTPKVILYFDNGVEDRRIPLVMKSSGVSHIDGKCIFSGEYSYRLDLLFWKTRNKDLPCDLYFNLSFADYYEEKISVDVTPTEFEQDNKFFSMKICDNHFVITKNAKKLASDAKKNIVWKVLGGIVQFVLLLISINISLTLFLASIILMFFCFFKLFIFFKILFSTLSILGSSTSSIFFV